MSISSPDDGPVWTYANLSGANLQNAVLAGTNTGANLVHANLTGTDLSGAVLTSGDLRHAVLVNTNLNDTNLATASFSSPTNSSGLISNGDGPSRRLADLWRRPDVCVIPKKRFLPASTARRPWVTQIPENLAQLRSPKCQTYSDTARPCGSEREHAESSNFETPAANRLSGVTIAVLCAGDLQPDLTAHPSTSSRGSSVAPFTYCLNRCHGRGHQHHQRGTLASGHRRSGHTVAPKCDRHSD